MGSDRLNRARDRRIFAQWAVRSDFIVLTSTGSQGAADAPRPRRTSVCSSAGPAPSFSSCQNTCPARTRSNKSSPSSSVCCAKPPRERSEPSAQPTTNFSAHSHEYANYFKNSGYAPG